jgi:hypothetical protein
MTRTTTALALCCSLLGACSNTDETAPATVPKPAPEPLAPLDLAPLTTEQVLVPSHAIIEATQKQNPQIPNVMDELLASGFGDVSLAAGEPLLPLTLDDQPAPMAGAGASLMFRFVHLADIQLPDDESPARFAALDIPLLSSPFRPQEAHECRILNAAVRTINTLHTTLPIDLVMLGGDNVDSAQQNEHEWLLAILSGASSVECDSGADNDPVPGGNNDPKDPFIADGLDVPWLWVMGNHDMLTQGLFPIAGYTAQAVGSYAPTGTRDWSQPGGPVIKGDVVADPRRAPLGVDAILTALMADGDGHGVDAQVMERGKASYVYDAPDAPLRLVVIDMSWPGGGSEGVITQSDIDSFVKPALDEAAAQGKFVILSSHQSSNTLATDADLGASGIPNDQLDTDSWQNFVAGYDNVLMHITGHSHIHRAHRREPPAGGRYWELITSALSDYPHQMRLIEVWDQDNGFVSVRSIALDFSTEGDAVAADGRARAIADLTSGWVDDASGAADDRNVELWIPKP